MSAWQKCIGFSSLILSLVGCHRQTPYCAPQTYTIQTVEKNYGNPNEIISKPNHTWYGYITKIQTDYPVKKNFSALYPPKPIATPAPVAHTIPEDSFARYGCAIWFKTNRSGVVIATRRTGSHCTEADYQKPVTQPHVKL